MDRLTLHQMPNLLLQPLVENAILHGIENREEGGGKLVLSGFMEDDCIVFHVEDNGVGIPPDLLPHLLETQAKGYRLKNVNDRTKLMYGQKYGLTIHSVEGEGTRVTLRFSSQAGSV
ncbi:sensor histidine kinase [Paenibacillus sp. GCM10027629]|uniref:sensor histidine kinase n=1 Tax=Paenibacillus sp. GCM10027629 TaxID=3273414 RepID=UPI00364417BD